VKLFLSEPLNLSFFIEDHIVLMNPLSYFMNVVKESCEIIMSF